MKQKRIVVYISEEDHNSLKGKLAAMGLNISQWLRGLIKQLLSE